MRDRKRRIRRIQKKGKAAASNVLNRWIQILPVVSVLQNAREISRTND